MRRLYLNYQIQQTVSVKLSWSHYCELLSISDPDKRSIYEKEAINANWSVRELLGLDRLRAFGTGTLPDTARLIRVLSEQTGAARRDVEACVLGEHGDSSMIPFSALRIAGKPAPEAPGVDPGQALERTHGIGMDIIEGKGSTEFGIGQATAWLCRTIV